MKRVCLLLCLSLCLLTGSRALAADPAVNAVIDWAAIVQPSIHNATAPRPASSSQVLHALVMLAIYDAVVAIEGGYEPYAAVIQAAPGADVRAAVATAAYRSARARIATSQQASLDQHYANYLSAIADGPAKDDGIAVGEAAASALLAKRANDGFGTVALYKCSAEPPPAGEFEPDKGCPVAPGDPQPIDVKLALMTPYTFAHAGQFRPDGPHRLRSKAYTEDFVETRDYGRVDSSVRTPEQTDVAYFWSEHAYVHWNRNLITLAMAQQLSVLEAARLFALVHTAAADAVIAGFEAKYHYAFWRPRTAIPRADSDDNPDTDSDATWTPLLLVNHPEYPSGHAFWSAALIDAVRAFFRTNKLTWTIGTSKAAVPQLVQTERTYTKLTSITREIENSRVWAGLHWRNSMREGARLGRQVARHVTSHFFAAKP